MSLKRNFNNVEIDEYFFWENQLCQFRAANFSSKNQQRKLHFLEEGVYKNVKCKTYCHYGESLKYLILSKIYLFSSNTLSSGEELSLELFKKTSAVIIEKEIANNAKKINKGSKHYEKIKNSIINELPKHFELINVYDFENSLDHTFVEKIPLKTYLHYVKNRLRKFMHSSIPSIDKDGEPYFKININNLSYDNGKVDIVITSIFNIRNETKHRNFIISMLFNYFYYFKNKELIEMIGDEFKEYNLKNVDIGKVIVYNPLNLTRHEYVYEEVKGTFVEMDLFRILNNYIENNSARTLNPVNCDYCENKIFCETRTRSRNKMAKKSILGFEKVNNKITEMI